jgi:hypothetical protein
MGNPSEQEAGEGQEVEEEEEEVGGNSNRS